MKLNVWISFYAYILLFLCFRWAKEKQALKDERVRWEFERVKLEIEREAWEAERERFRILAFAAFYVY